MKQIAVIAAAVLSLTLVAPALAQPFADVPTDHWAYDAIAELAAKGLIEGYPDGAFRGDRAMTRYEMAMVVARLLARIEAIKIPPLPPDLVRRAELAKTDAATRAALTAVDKRLTAKLATVQRLVAEFRAELAALGVRVTAVEEELAAIRARLDNTRVTGDFRLRYNVFPVGSPSGAATLREPDIRIRSRITFTGRVTPTVTAVARLWLANNPGTTIQLDQRLGLTTFSFVSSDLLYLDIDRTWFADRWRIGRQAYALAPFGPFGSSLLYDPLWAPQIAVQDGIRSDWTLGPLKVTGAIFKESTNPAAPGTGLGGAPIRDFQIIRATSAALVPGWTLGGSFYRQVAAVGGPVDTGVSGDFSGTLVPGLTLYVEYASWTPAGFAAAPAWRVGGNVDLARLAGITALRPNVDWWYKNSGPLPAGGFAPPYSVAAGTDLGQANLFNWQGWGTRLNVTITPRTTAWLFYESGTSITPAVARTEMWARLAHTLAPGTTGTLNWFRFTSAGVDIVNFYRAELLYSW